MVFSTSPFLQFKATSLLFYRYAFLALALISFLLIVFNYSSLNNSEFNMLTEEESIDVTGYRAESQFEVDQNGSIILSCAIQSVLPNEKCGLEFDFEKAASSASIDALPSFANLETIDASVSASRDGVLVDIPVTLTFHLARHRSLGQLNGLRSIRYESAHFMPNTPQLLPRERVVPDSWWNEQFDISTALEASDLSSVTGVSLYLESSAELQPGRYEVTIDRLMFNQHLASPGSVNLILALVWPTAMLVFLAHYLLMKRAEVHQLSVQSDTDPETGMMNMSGLRRLYPGKLTSPVTVINIRVKNFFSLQKEFSRQTVFSLIQQTFQPFTSEQGARLLMVKPQDENILLIGGACDESLFGKLISASKNGIKMESLGHLRLDLKMGIAKGEKGMTMEALLAQSTIAIDAINEGEASYKLYHPELRKAWRQARFVEQELRIALKQKAFHLAFMPIYDAAEQRICGAEALLRTSHLPLKSFSPEVYVRVAEQAGLIREIDLWVLEEAIKALQKLNQKDFVMAVNISSRELMDIEFAEELRSLITRYHITPSQLCLEVTETFFLDVHGICFESIQAIRDLGVQLSLDDFGTGHASLQHLLNMPIDEIKIDRSFVWTLDNEKSAVIVDAIVSIAGICQYHVVAEGIETEAQLNKLAGLGCRYFQGYLIAKPDSFEKLVVICSEVKSSSRLDTQVKLRA